MKVYVSEMPKSCRDCPFYKLDTYVDIAGYTTNSYECVLDGSMLTNSCPLQSLSDYTKQVRKEVCEVIWGGFVGLNNLNGNYEYKKFEDDFRKFLDQIEQGETK